MDYNEAVNYIHGAHKFGWKLGLHNISTLLSLMGNPHKKLKYVHVAGTNGKGSTVSFISSILIQSGYKVGIFTSPYLERFTERIKINNEEISEKDLARITEFVRKKVDIMLERGESHPTEFELITAIAFQYYYEQECDVVVLEVGLGGRLDSTNVIDASLVSVITTISYDHMDRLGTTLGEIAFEKAGIIKWGGDVVVYQQESEADEVLKRVCTEREAVMHRVDFSDIKDIEFGIEGQVFNLGRYQSLRIPLLGEHQAKNAAIAVKACEIIAGKDFNITEDSIRKGLVYARWPGRFEVMKKSPAFIIDGAHNAEGAKVLSETLQKYFPDRKILFIVGVLKDKDFKSIIKPVLHLAKGFITVTPDSERALPAKDLAMFINNYCKNVSIGDTIEEAVETSLAAASPDDVVCAFGSLYCIGRIRKYLTQYKYK